MTTSQLNGSLDLLLLALLASGEAHGYALVTRLKELSSGAFDLAEGTVYPALHRLERDGLLVSRWDASSGRKRRAYAITESGRDALRQKRREWSLFSEAVAAVVSTPAVAR